MKPSAIKHTIIFILFFLFTYVQLFGQLNYKKVDSISFLLYEQKKWNELIQFGNETEKESFDYYFLNLRIGIAYYNLKNYQKSILFFERALKNNSESEVANEYLYWNYIQLQNYKKAKVYYNKLDTKIKEKITYKPKKLFDFIYVEGGQNFQQDRSSKNGNITYLNIGLNHRFSYNFNFYHSYYYQEQDLEFSDYNIHRYYLKPTLKLKNNFEIGLAFNYTKLKSNINFSETITYSSTEEDILLDDGIVYDRIIEGEQLNKNSGTLREEDIFIETFFTKFIEKFRFSVSAGFVNKKTKTRTISSVEGTENVVLLFKGNEVFNEDFPFEEEDLIEQDITELKYYFGLDIGYDITPKLGVELDLKTIQFDNTSEFNFISSIAYKVSDKLEFSANFLQKRNSEYYYYNGAFFINSTEDTKRFGLISDISLTKKINLLLVFQHDIIDAVSSNRELNSNTFIAGLKYKL